LQVLQAQQSSAVRESKTYTDQGQDPPAALSEHIDDLQGKITTETSLLGQYTSNRQSLTDAVLRGAGGNINKPKNTTEDLMPDGLPMRTQNPKNGKWYIYDPGSGKRYLDSNQGG
jgi:hypothetical protein